MHYYCYSTSMLYLILENHILVLPYPPLFFHLLE